LSVDVFRQDGTLVIRAMIAGVTPENLELNLDGDLLTIRGKRADNVELHEDEWFYRECYWGSFSRSLILPLDVYTERAEANFLNGALEVRIPIRETQSFIPIRIAKKT
jgi:HSP20 family protein